MEPACARSGTARPLNGAPACVAVDKASFIAVACSILLENAQLVLSSRHSAVSRCPGKQPATPTDTQMHTPDHDKLGTGIQPLTVTIPEAVRLSGLSRSELYRQLSAGHIHARKSGSRTLILWASLKAHVEALPEAEFRAPKAA